MTTRCVRSLTDLTEAQWRYWEPLLPSAKRRGRPRTPLRQVVEAILYVVKAGCQWRLLAPKADGEQLRPRDDLVHAD